MIPALCPLVPTDIASITPSLQSWVGMVPAEFNIINGQNFALISSSLADPALPPLGYTRDNISSVTTGVAGGDGTNTASTLVEPNHNSTVTGIHVIHRLYANVSIGQGFNELKGIPMRCVVIAKPNAKTRFVLRLQDRGSLDEASDCYDLAGLHAGFSSVATNWTIEASTIEKPFPASGFVKCTLDFTVAGPNTLTQIGVDIILDNGSGTAARVIDYGTNASSNGLDLWYAVLLPKAAWNFSNVWLDDFDNPNTIDKFDTREPGFNWFPHNWDYSFQTGANFTNPTTPPSQITVAGSCLTLNCPTEQSPISPAVATACQDKHSTTFKVFGTTFRLPAIFQAKIAYDPTSTCSPAYGGTHPAIVLYATCLGDGLEIFDLNCEIDVTDGTAGTTGFVPGTGCFTNTMDHVMFYQQGGAAGVSPINITDFKIFAEMAFPAATPTNGRGFSMPFWKDPFSTQTINSMFTRYMSKQWTSSNFDTQEMYMNICSGSGDQGKTPPRPPTPTAYDFVKVITCSGDQITIHT